jgi:hypothetical protein
LSSLETLSTLIALANYGPDFKKLSAAAPTNYSIKSRIEAMTTKKSNLFQELKKYPLGPNAINLIMHSDKKTPEKKRLILLISAS